MDLNEAIVYAGSAIGAGIAMISGFGPGIGEGCRNQLVSPN